MSDDNLTLLIIGMLVVIKDPSEGISKNGYSFFEGNAMLRQICFGLLWIPLELKKHSREMLPRRLSNAQPLGRRANDQALTRAEGERSLRAEGTLSGFAAKRAGFNVLASVQRN